MPRPLAAHTVEQFFTQQLLKWNKTTNRRSMPWKGIKDPYRIWLSEVILQQTRVEQGMAYYEKFVQQFPRITDLALAEDSLVMKTWEGLGYYSRCRNLLKTARLIAFEQGGQFPQQHAEILSLPGIGPYTAAAIASFAFDLPHAVVDGNVYRVLSRYFNQTLPIDQPQGKNWFAQKAQSLLPPHQAAQFNQAIMDLGATLCTPRNPQCQSCPLQAHCAGHLAGQVNQLPVKAKALARSHRYFLSFCFRHQGKIWVRERTEKDIWQNLYEFLVWEEGGDSPYFGPEDQWKATRIKALTSRLQKSFQGLDWHHLSVSPLLRQALTHREVWMRVVVVDLKGKRPTLPADGQWVTASQAQSLAFPRIYGRWREAEKKLILKEKDEGRKQGRLDR